LSCSVLAGVGRVEWRWGLVPGAGQVPAGSCWLSCYAVGLSTPQGSDGVLSYFEPLVWNCL
jgi:hypothetical protein